MRSIEFRRILARTCMLFAGRCANFRAQSKDETGNDLRVLPAGLCCTFHVWRRDTARSRRHARRAGTRAQHCRRARIGDAACMDAVQARTKLRSGRWAMTAPYASPAIRDEFLAALDADDRTLSTRLAANLTGCINPLPSMTCNMLGLPTGSTYGSAASRVLQLYSVPR